MKKIMLNVLLLACVYFAMNGCMQQKEVDLVTEKARVKIVIDQFEQFWETEDVELLSKTMAHDSDMICFGTDATEVFKGWENLKTSLESMLPAVDSISINVRDQSIKVDATGKVAWFTQFWDWDFVYGGQAVQIPNQRLTGVLENRDGVWVMVQFHNSVHVMTPAE